MNNEKKCREISKDKIAVCEKTAGLRSGNSLDLDSACLKALVPVEIFQFSGMHYESRFLNTFRGHNTRPTWMMNVLRHTVQNFIYLSQLIFKHIIVMYCTLSHNCLLHAYVYILCTNINYY